KSSVLQRMEIDFGECQNAIYVGTQLSTFECQTRSLTKFRKTRVVQIGNHLELVVEEEEEVEMKVLLEDRQRELGVVWMMVVPEVEGVERVWLAASLLAEVEVEDVGDPEKAAEASKCVQNSVLLACYICQGMASLSGA
ncbi:hypothetical protein ABTG52_07625, partial [Acinetobacter baumannii]